MEISLTIALIIAVAALIIGFVIAYLIRGNSISALNKENEMIKEKLETQEEKLSRAVYEKENIASELTRAVARASAAEEHNRSLEEWIKKADVMLKDSFASLSKDITEKNNAVFLSNANDKLNDFAQKLGENLKGNNEAVSGIINPVGKELEELRKKVEDMEKARASAYTGLVTQVDALSKQNTDLKTATDLLNNTLRNNAQRGRWGEQQLHKVAELAGMVEHIDFEEQEKNAEGTRPDMIVKLTGERTIPVDSKAPMAAYMQYLEDTTEDMRKKHLEEHVSALKKHINDLHRKAYWKEESRSVEMVAMVVPYESGLSAAFAIDQEIFSYAMERNVLLLSPMTFYAFLKSVSIGWQENAMTKNAKEIASLSRELIDRFNVFFEYFNDIDKALTGARDKYDKAVSSYNRRLLPTFTKFENVSKGYELSDGEQNIKELNY